TVALDQPGFLWPKDAGLTGRGNALVGQEVAGAQPDFASPRPGTYRFAEPEPAESFGKCFTIRSCPFITKHNQMTPERLLHVPGGFADAWLPVHPGLSQQFTKNPAINVSASVVPNVYDQPVAGEHRRILFNPLVDVGSPHRAQVHISDATLRFL